MCVICIKPDKTKFPPEERMRAMFDANPDGAGFMFVRGKKVIIRKGFMKFKHFRKALESEAITDDEVCVMHFRIATHGGVSPKNTHPFPISDDIDELKSLRHETDMAMAHNGIISYPEDKKNHLSDTMTFVKEVLSEKNIRNNLFEFPTFSLVEMAIGSSKIVVMDKNKRFVLLGNWVKDSETKDGLYYSNLYFKTTFRRSSFKGHWDNTTQKMVYELDKDDEDDFPTTHCETTYPAGTFVKGAEFSTSPTVMKGDLDKDAYENKGKEVMAAVSKAKPTWFGKKDDFAKKQLDSFEYVDYDDVECPRCKEPIDSTRRLFCQKCGAAFYRLHDEVMQ